MIQDVYRFAEGETAPDGAEARAYLRYTPDREEIYRAIWDYEEKLETKYTSRLTADIVLNNINVVAKHYAKRFSNRRKKQ